MCSCIRLDNRPALGQCFECILAKPESSATMSPGQFHSPPQTALHLQRCHLDELPPTLPRATFGDGYMPAPEGLSCPERSKASDPCAMTSGTMLKLAVSSSLDLSQWSSAGHCRRSSCHRMDAFATCRTGSCCSGGAVEVFQRQRPAQLLPARWTACVDGAAMGLPRHVYCMLCRPKGHRGRRCR